MIYLIISDCFGRSKYSENKRDCLNLRQPLPNIPDNLRSYIEMAKDPLVKSERLMAYTSLLCSLKVFFNIDDPVIEKNADGKPFLKLNSSNVFFNISHSDGICVVALSDECDVGVDIQNEIDRSKALRLEERYLKDVEFNKVSIPINAFHLNVFEDCFSFCKIDLDQSLDKSFTERWTSLESVLKLNGAGFGNLSIAGRLAEKVKTDTRKIVFSNNNYYISLSIKNIKNG